MTEGLFNTLDYTFKQQYNETIKLLQFQALVRQGNENEWLDFVPLLQNVIIKKWMANKKNNLYMDCMTLKCQQR